MPIGVKNSFSYSEVLRKLNLNITGSSHKNIKQKILKLNLDIKHFNPYKPVGGNLNKKKSADLVLVYDINLKNRLDASKLRRVLFEIGREYKCEKCSNDGKWQNVDLLLEVDHIDGNWKNNTRENLRFLCPNCHSQTNTWGSKNNKYS